MTLRRKVNLILSLLLLSVLSLRGEEKIFPLEIDVIFSPCPCGEKVYIFSKNGRNQTLNAEDNAPNCNLFPLNPIVQPICYQNKTFVADIDGSFYFLSEEGTKPAGKATDKIIGAHTFNEKLFIVYEKSIKEFEGEEINLPFKAVSSFSSEKGIFLFGQDKFGFFEGQNDLKIFPFSMQEAKGAAAIKENFIVCGRNDILFLNKKGKVFRKFSVKSDVVSAIAVNEDKIAVASNDHFVRLFDKKGNVVWQYRLEGAPTNIIIAKKGILAASKGGTQVVLIDFKKGVELWSFHTKEGEIHSLSFQNSKAIFFTLKENLEWVLNIVDIPL